MKESQRYNVSVLINHHRDFEKMLSSDVRSPITSFLSPDDGFLKSKRYNVDFFHIRFFTLDYFVFLIFLHIVEFFSIIYFHIYIYIYIYVCMCVCVVAANVFFHINLYLWMSFYERGEYLYPPWHSHDVGM